MSAPRTRSTPKGTVLTRRYLLFERPRNGETRGGPLPKVGLLNVSRHMLVRCGFIRTVGTMRLARSLFLVLFPPWLLCPQARGVDDSATVEARLRSVLRTWNIPEYGLRPYTNGG